ncbi:DUF2730 domain-containing protein [Mesorhizobium sp. J428]|uniref:DUF2730 domain-containing protein n=1 Tax=Mesorhizobium sp. J428 TaxID=2898440 RepID=UPI0021511D68|nr:DUF2730 domain-containing protein [Mesorhizobium sp. J428]MCR5855980.1 DUF2730 domain-containing protein [Mesorhizobium sp. J428]
MLQEIKDWLGVAALLISVGGFLYAWLSSGAKKAMTDLEVFKSAEAERWEKIDAVFIEHERRVQSIENELKHLPSQKSVHELQLTLKDMQVEMAKIGASADQSARTAARVETYLLEHGK